MLRKINNLSKLRKWSYQYKFWDEFSTWLILGDLVPIRIDKQGFRWPLYDIEIAGLKCYSFRWKYYYVTGITGQRWYGFGWESQLLETGLLGMWGVPLLSLAALPEASPPSPVLIWGLRWLIFRIMLGAGMIKIRGDQCWLDLTCMNYHYQVSFGQQLTIPLTSFC